MLQKITLYLFILLITTFSLSAQTTYYVSTSGNNSDPGTLSQPFATIQHAVDVATAGSTVYVMGGTYYERIYMDYNSGTAQSPIVFKNYNNEQVHIDGGGTSAGVGDAIWAITDVDHITIDGFIFQNIINNYVKGLVIFDNCDSITITNSTFTNIHFSNNPNAPVNSNKNVNPLIVYSTDPANPVTNVTFSNNEVYNCRTGFSEGMTLNGNVDGFVIENNYVHDITNIGIVVAGHYGACSDPAVDQVRNGVVRNNTVHDCKSDYAIAGGIYVDGAKNVIVENNISYDGQIGFSIGCENLGKTTDNITVRNNIAYNNETAGIEIGGYDYPSFTGKVTNSRVYGNTCYKNDTGNNWVGELWITHNDNLTVKNNIFYADNANKVVYYYEANNGSGNLVDYNLYNTPTGANNCLFSYDGEGYGSFAYFQQATGSDPNSLFGDPQFVDALNRDFHIEPSSPAIDAGDLSILQQFPQVDIDGQTRASGAPDCGADEFYECASIAVWDGNNWDSATPTLAETVIINGPYSTATDNIEACTLLVNANLTVPSGTFIKVAGDVKVNTNGNLRIEHEGSLVQVNDDATTYKKGNIEVEKVTPPLSEKEFMVIGSPMSAETREGVYANSYIVRNHLTENFVPNPDVENMFPLAENFADDNGNNWLPHTGLLNPAEGYLVFPQPDGNSSGSYTQTYTQGILNNGIYNFNIKFNGTQNGSPNVLANPYPSAVDADLFFAETENAEIDVLYFWEHLTPASTSYPGFYTANYDMADISLYSEAMGGLPAANGGPTPNNVIASGQGFGIKAVAAGTAVFKNNMRITGPNDTYRKRALAERERIWINVANHTYGLGSTTMIGFSSSTSDMFETNADIKRLATPVSLYSELQTGEQLAINALGDFGLQKHIDLSFATQVEEVQEYSITIHNLDGNIVENTPIYLIDNALGNVVDLTSEDYRFESNAGTFAKRFTVVFENPTLGTENFNAEWISVYPIPTSGVVNIHSPTAKISGVVLHDISGRKVLEQTLIDKKDYKVNLEMFEAAVYFMTVNTERGTIIKRIVKK